MVRVASKPVVAARAPAVEVSAAVQRLTIDEGSVGQRLDNFLIKVLKGAPKTLVYRIIRSGEVRRNKGRIAADDRVQAGDLLYIPADMPHLPMNPGPGPARAVIARTDPHEKESVVLLPELEHLVP